MNSDKRIDRVLHEFYRFAVFFMLIAFLVTCCLLLFLSQMQQATGIVFTHENIQQAAKITFANVLLLTCALMITDSIRRRYMVQRPLREILKAAERIMQGDFSARVPTLTGIDRTDPFHDIADCINRLAEELSGTETLRTDFIANVSHELKTPLAAIQNYASLLGQPKLTEERRQEYSHAIAQTTMRLTSLITNILKLNKLENQQIFPQKQRYDLGEQLCQCMLGFEDAWEQKQLDIETSIEENVFVSCDAELLTLVWNNLFSNAIKFTGPGGRIALSLAKEGHYAVVQVSDTGCGFGPDVGRHIFEKFYQGDRSHATQGNGLGLTLVRRVVDIVGGEITVASEIGRGSTFTVRIRAD